MKKLVVSLVCLLIPVCLSVFTAIAETIPIDEAHFPDDAFRAYVSAAFDTNGDGMLSEEERNDALFIDVSSRGIRSLQGIEFFPELWYLNCPSNELTSLDVSGNASLTELYCYGNSLTSLDISSCVALTSLSCDNNSLTSLDISSCAALTYLACSENSLTSLDASGNSLMKWLYCYGNSLTSLDIYGCAALESLSCADNSLTSLDISGCAALTYLACSENSLTSLDVSGHAALTYLFCTNNSLTSLDLSGRAALTYVDCSNNSLTSLDISGCAALTTLLCSANSMTSLDVSGLDRLTELHCTDNGMTSLNVSGCTALTTLYCHTNSLTQLDLSDNTSLISFGCDSNTLPVDAENKSFDLSTLPGFDQAKASDWEGGTVSGTILTFRSNRVSYAYDCGNGFSAVFVLERFEPGVAINEINFPDYGFRWYIAENFDLDGSGVLSEEEINAVSMINPMYVTIFSFQGIEFFPGLALLMYGTDDCDCLESLDVSHNTKLTGLNIFSSRLTSLDVSHNPALIELECDGSPMLTSLDVSHNPALKRLYCSGNPLLTSLDVSHNPALVLLECDDDQLQSLDLSHNPALGDIRCNNNRLTSLTLPENSSIGTIQCNNNQLTSLDLSRAPELFRLNCSGNQLTNLDVPLLAHLTTLECDNNRLTALDLSRNTLLEDLHCAGNRLTELDLSKNTQLEILHCEGNQLTALNLTKNPKLLEVDCDDNRLESLDLTRCTKLSSLSCSGNTSLPELNLNNNTSLFYLECRGMGLTSLNLSRVGDLRSLDCSNNNLTSLDLTRIKQAYRVNCSNNDLTWLNVSYNRDLDELYCSGNGRRIELSGGTFDLSTLAGFDVSKASGWQGGTVKGKILTVTGNADVTYTYDCGNGHSTTFTLWLGSEREVTEGDFICLVGAAEAKLQAYTGAGPEAAIPAAVKGKPVRVIGSGAFGPGSLDTLVIPGAVEEIEDGAFDHMCVLHTVRYQGTVAQAADIRIGSGNGPLTRTIWTCTDGSFSVPLGGTGADGLSWSRIGSTLTVAGSGDMADHAGAEDTPWAYLSFTRVVIEEGVTGVGDHAFQGMPVEAVSLPDTLRRIGSMAFADMSALDELYIPESVTEIGEDVVSGDSPQIACVAGSYAHLYVRRNGLAVKRLVIPAFSADLELPDGLVSIGDEAFCGIAATGVRIPAGTQIIGGRAFANCRGLKMILIPDSVTSIATDAFLGAPEGMLIYGRTGSAAEAFAAANGYWFAAVE